MPLIFQKSFSTSRNSLQEPNVRNSTLNVFQTTQIVREPNSENCLDLIFVASLCEKVIFVLDTKYITSAIRKFMLEMPSPGSYQNIGL